MAIQIYLIKSGTMLDIVKKCIEDYNACLKVYGDFARRFNATEYVTNGERLCDLKLPTPPEGWTKPSSRDKYSHPKKNAIGYEEFRKLPSLPQTHGLIIDELEFPTFIRYELNGISQSVRLRLPYSHKFLYSLPQGVYAVTLPDIKSKLAIIAKDGGVVTNGADTWAPPDGIEAITNEQFKDAVKNDVK